MNKSILTALAFTLSLLTGCAGHIYNDDGGCITCFNNPISGEPLNHDGEANKKREADKVAAETAKESVVESSTKIKNKKFTEYEIKMTVPVDVDVAFIKLKKEFNFYSDEQIKQEYGDWAEFKFKSADYAWESNQGIYHHMRATRKHEGQEFVIDVVTEKAGSGESTITTKFWLEETNTKGDTTKRSLRKRIRSTLGLK